MNTLQWIVLATVLSGVASAMLASGFLLAGARVRNYLLPHMVSFATGTLLGAAFIGLLPRAIETAGAGNAGRIGLAVLGGLLAFFVLEKLVLWRHCHHDTCEVHAHDDKAAHDASGTLILVGDGFHNLLDGVLIAAAFLTDFHLGVVTTLAVFAHELPQELGDIAILLHSGMSRGRALVLNLLVSLTSVVGAVLAYFWLAGAEAILPYVLSVAAASFVYVAVADLIPGLHRRLEPGAAVSQFTLIVLGVLVVVGATRIAHGLTH
jgi:zinc and cadmium transporter